MNLVRTRDGGKTEKWMEKLLSTEFFGDCGEHRCLRKNVFCIDCRVGICRHCADSHLLHRRLQICKYVYQYVLRLLDIQPHFDCSQIQAYKINGEKAIHLNPRPQAKDAKPSTKSKNGASCETCRRYIQDIPNRFCSISCKMRGLSTKHGYQLPYKIIGCANEEENGLNIRDEREPSTPKGSLEEKLLCSPSSSSSLADVSDDSPENLLCSFSFRSLERLRKRKYISRRSPLF